MPRLRIWLIASVAVLSVLAAACGGGKPQADGDPQASPTPQASESVTDEPSESPEPEPDPEPKFTAEITVAGGRIDGPEVVEVSTGDKVAIAVTSDVADHVHVHGYDELVDLVPGERAVLRFTANIPGVWEVELEDAGDLLFELKVE